MKRLRTFSLVFVFCFLALFLAKTPKKGFFRSGGVRVPVAEAGTLETVPTYVTLTEAVNYPSVTNIHLNGGGDIYLSENTTKGVSLSGNVTDNDGCADIGNLSGVIYLNALDLSCASDDNSCYTGGDVTCSTTTCNGGTAEVTCAADMWFHANSEQWKGAIKVTDGSSNTDEGISDAVTVKELQTLLVTSVIDYGLIIPGNTTASNQSVVVTATGNVAINCSLSGTGMTSVSATHTIDVTQQKYDLTDGGNWDSLGNTLLSTDAALNLDLSKPTSHPTGETDIVWWGLKVPAGTPKADDYGGTNTFTATPG